VGQLPGRKSGRSGEGFLNPGGTSSSEISEILGKLPCKEKSSLIVLPGMDKNLILAARNLQNTGIMPAKDLNTLDLLRFNYLVMPKEAIKVLKETFLK